MTHSVGSWGELEALYPHLGRPSIAPDRLLRALLQAFYSVRSARLLMEQLDYNLLYRWFVGLGIDDPVWHPTAFTHRAGFSRAASRPSSWRGFPAIRVSGSS
jgi:transposase